MTQKEMPAKKTKTKKRKENKEKDGWLKERKSDSLERIDLTTVLLCCSRSVVCLV